MTWGKTMGQHSAWLQAGIQRRGLPATAVPPAYRSRPPALQSVAVYTHAERKDKGMWWNRGL